jgi:hypothetical protein
VLGVPQEAEVRYHNRGDDAQPCDDFSGVVEPLFRTIGRGTGKLTRTVLPQANAYAMIRRRAGGRHRH